MTPLAFIDLETTGATAGTDRITEIGIVQIDADGSVCEWQQLVNPGVPISPFIEQLTGISNAMVAKAPPFAAVAEEALRRLQGRLFIAHNARFDYGFMKSEFKRLGITFRAPVLCTVKLSRTLFPEHKRHNLDSLMARHGLQAAARHRALADAQLIHQFWQRIHENPGPEAVQAALSALNTLPRLPPQLDTSVIDELPEAPGVYVFYGENDLPRHVGKAKDLRQSILAHFAAEQKSAKNRALAQEVRRIEWIETAGEIGAQLKEAALHKALLPGHKRPPRKTSGISFWPFKGPAILREGDDMHLIDNWHHLGTTHADEQIQAWLGGDRPPFDPDIYKILFKHAGKMTPLPSGPQTPHGNPK